MVAHCHIEGKKWGDEIEHILIVVVESSMSGYNALNSSCSLWKEIRVTQLLPSPKRLRASLFRSLCLFGFFVALQRWVMVCGLLLQLRIIMANP